MTTIDSNNACSRETDDDRLASVAAILALGVLRLRKLRTISPDAASQNSSESPRNSLDVPSESRLSVHTG